jgi:hypothetical protein
MRTTSWAAAAAITFLGTFAFATGVAAQTAPQGQINPTADQTESFINSLANIIEQSLPSAYQPSVGSTVPQEVKTQPIPDAAEAAIPQAADQHVVKTDDYFLIVDPTTRQVLGMISASDLDGDVTTPNAGSGKTP